MKKIRIFNTLLNVKDYYCSSGENYARVDNPKLWLYVNINNNCQAKCPFCVNPPKNECLEKVDPKEFSRTLNAAKEIISGVSLTGGEPLMDITLVDDIIGIVTETFAKKMEIDLVTNGVCLSKVNELQNIDYLDSIHISRHMILDDDNRRIMGAQTPSVEEIKSIGAKLSDPGKLVFNCVLQKGGVDSTEKAKEFLEMASRAKVLNTSFVGMFQANDYCKETYVDPQILSFEETTGFHIWNHYHDYDFCSCSSGSYDAKEGAVRYYYRSPGKNQANYVRQLVYTADNRLLAGFGGDEIVVP